MGSRNQSCRRRTRAPVVWPLPIFHPSRAQTTYAHLTFPSIIQNPTTGTNLATAFIFAAAASEPIIDYDKDRGPSISGPDGGAGECSLGALDGDKLQPSSQCWSSSSWSNPETLTGDGSFGEDGESEDLEFAPAPIAPESAPAPVDRDAIYAWSMRTDGSEPIEPLPHSPFSKGSFGGLTSNDWLMLTGALKPSEYTTFHNLSSFKI
jgi:hypothetical protein